MGVLVMTHINPSVASTISNMVDFGGDTLEALIALCTDICRRNGMEELVYTGDTSGSLTIHKMFADTACPGPYLESRMEEIAETVSKNLKGY